MLIVAELKVGINRIIKIVPRYLIIDDYVIMEILFPLKAEDSLFIEI